MKFTPFITLFILIYVNSASQSVCYAGNLKFGNESCRSDITNKIPSTILEGKKRCHEIACMPYLGDFEAYICFQKKDNSRINFIISYKNMEQVKYNILLSEENESYVLKRVAISGTKPWNSHITLRVVSGTLAYRLAYNVQYLNHENNNDLILQRLGLDDTVLWEAFINYDNYDIIDRESGSYQDHFTELHDHNTKTSIAHDNTYLKDSSNKDKCPEWSSIMPHKMTTAKFKLDITTTVQVSEASDNTTVWLGVTIIVIILCSATVIMLLVYFLLKQKKNPVQRNPVTFNSNVGAVEIQIEHQPSLPQLVPELPPPPPPLPPPPQLVDEAIQNNCNANSADLSQMRLTVPSQSPQNVSSLPPSYRTNDSAQAFTHFIFGLGVLQYINNMVNRNNIPRPREIGELEPLSRISQNELALE